jgi:hypothetical protein
VPSAPRTEPHTPKGVAPKESFRVLGLRVMATRCVLACLLCARVTVLALGALPKESAARKHHPLAPSSAPDKMSRRFSPCDRNRPIRPRCQLVKVPPLFRSPQSLLYVRSLCQGLGTVSLYSAFPRKGRVKELSPVSQEALHTAPINFGNPISLLHHPYYVK